MAENAPSPIPPEAVEPQTDASLKKAESKEDTAWQEISIERDKIKARLDLNEARLRRINEQEGEPGPDADADQQQENRPIGDLEARVIEDRRLYAKKTLELWRAGGIEKLEPEDLAMLSQDLIDLAERSALAELVLSRHGFKTAQEALRKLKLKEVEIDGLIVNLPDENGLKRLWRSPAFQEQLKKLGLSGGVSLATAGVIALVGGPVSWLTLAGGLTGGVAGRALGEFVRTRMLRKKVEDYGQQPEAAANEGEDNDEQIDQERRGFFARLPMFGRFFDRRAEDGEEVEEEGRIAFNEKVARDLFELVVSMQSRAQEINEDASLDENARCQKIIELVKQASEIESRSQKDYKRMERNAARIKSGLAIIGAIGGSVAMGALAHGEAASKITEQNELRQLDFERAHQEGIRIYHDASGQAHVTADPELGHVVKQTSDNAWRYVIENKDVETWHQMAAERGEWVKDFYHHYLESTGEYPSVPDVLESGKEYLHAGTIDYSSVEHAINEHYDQLINHIRAQDLWARLIGGGTPVLATAMTEALYGSRAKGQEKKMESEGRRLVDSVGEVEEKIRGKIIFQKDNLIPESWELPTDPRYLPKFFEDLADGFNVPLPKNPRGYEYNWNKQPDAIDDEKILEKIDFWFGVDNHEASQLLPRVSIGDRKVVEVGVLGVSPVKNRIALVMKVHTPEGQVIYPVSVVRLDTFLSTYHLHITRKKGMKGKKF